MAWMIGRAVIRGEIDNTTEGVITGRIWLLGREQPVVLHLQGDCWRDLAGTQLVFENPKPELAPEVVGALAGAQVGLAGDITASRRTRGGLESEFPGSPDHPVEHPDTWHNCLYVEWFSEANGRVLIESDWFEIRPGEVHWRMDADAEQAQKLANLQAMRDYIAGVIRRREVAPADCVGVDDAGEFEWEQRLKESDRLTSAYQEVREKYGDEQDAEQKEAFVMGWDGLLGALADQHENGHRAARAGEFDGFKVDSAAEDETALDEDLDDGPFDDLRAGHPLQEQSHELAMRAFDLVPHEGPAGSPADRLVSNLLEVSGKLAGALVGDQEDYQPETGYVLAVLKRCMHRLNEAVAACVEMIAHEDDPDHRRALEALHHDIFEVRDEIVELRRELRHDS